jgi:hypothetical protein
MFNLKKIVVQKSTVNSVVEHEVIETHTTYI